ncbi:lipoate-protein ligase A, putative [Cordyceps militaris CM01]|uniref:Putative lipoate-protein ligase A n=1 Tax=Cordyceps militaris (strain CM01) TaxID=983644 RepID=G3J853_CORMM|nr:lipoate-protein ligase A, putative [Cordyceps militaris CM01]EGX93895.1 lipoate-protein ligase A, putative [Cordyceps militaris CM01]
MACRPRLLCQLSRRLFSTAAAADPSHKTQIYLSRSADPLLNLSVEHHLLRTVPADATVLMLYANAPCVVVGRNQNPWIETDLARLAGGGVQLVRRRSGGGTVFHDPGNVNFSVIGPSAAFDRDRHADMVVRALRRLGRPTARVNARHDIVVDEPGATFKVSGSAYKLTRLRSLHHGTCLLRSPHLDAISGLLRAPAAPFVRARGVESVRSPVRNLDLDADAFRDAVVREFEAMYGPPDVRAVVEDGPARAVDPVRRGYAEMASREWLYGQTPRFTLSTHPTEQDPRPRPKLPFEERVYIEAKQGVIERFQVENGNGARRDLSSLVGVTMYNINDWSAQLADAGIASHQAQPIGNWLNSILGTAFTRQ